MSSSADKFSYSSESDDDAPGEVNSSAARSTKLSQIQSARQLDKEAKQKEREKRKDRNELFTFQKKQKLESFEGRALPEDILEAVSSKHNELDEEIGDEFSDANEGEDDSGNDGEEGSDSDSDDDYHSEDDFIALDSSVQKDGVRVVTVEEPKKNTSSLEKALAFRNNRLFSGPNAAKRCSGKKRKNLVAKRKAMA